jgi:hypothetical protein
VQNHNSATEDSDKLKKLLAQVDDFVKKAKSLQEPLQTDPGPFEIEIKPSLYSSPI